MVHTFDSAGFPSVSARERRLCLLLGAAPSSPERRDLPGIGAINSFLSGMESRLEGLVNPGKDEGRRTMVNLNDMRQWLTAFERPDIYTAPVHDRRALTNKEFTPEDLLQTMSRTQRNIEFYRFARANLPPGLLSKRPPDPEFALAGFAARDFTSFVAESGGGDRLEVPTNDQRTAVLNVIAIVLGMRVAPPGRVRNLALEAFEEIYPSREIVGGGIYQDYYEAIHRIQDKLGSAAPLTPAQLRDREFLLTQLSRLAPSRFGGWLRVMNEPPQAEVAQKRLNALASQFQIDELTVNEVTFKSHEQRDKLQKGPRDDAERRNKTFLQNMETIQAQNPMLFYGICALGAWAAYKMFTSKSRLFGVLPYWTIPTGLLGYYVYRRTILGDEHALDTITGSVQRGGQNLYDATTNLFSRGGILPATPEREDLTRMGLMSRFLDQKAFLRNFPIATPMMAMSEVPLGMLAAPDVTTVTILPTGALSYSFYAREGSALYSTMEGIVKRRSYDRNTLQLLLRDPQINSGVAKGIASVFYQLACRRRGGSTDSTVAEIEKARTDAAVFRSGRASEMGYDNISNIAIKQKYVSLIQEGRLIAMEQYPTLSFVQVIDQFIREPERAERYDGSERVPEPGIETNMTRGAERAMYTDARRNPFLPRETSNKELEAEFAEFIAYCRRAGSFEIINAEGADTLNRFARDLINDPTKTHAQILLILERVKYAIFVSATQRGGGSPLGGLEIGQIIGTDGSPDRLNVETILGNIARYLNTIVTVSSDFQRVDSITNVQTMLAGRFFSGIESAGMPDLRKQLAAHRARFDRLRNPSQAAELFARSIPPEIIGRFGTRDRFMTFVQRMVAAPGQYRDFINDAEKYYAQRVANDLVLAQLTVHRSTGEHTLIDDPADRFISRRKEQNLLINNEFLLRSIMGTDENRPLNGMWAGMMMREVLSSFPAERLSDDSDEPSRLQAVETTRRIATLFMSLDSPGPEEAIDLELRNRVRTIARSFLDQWNRGPAGWEKAAEALRKARDEEEKIRKESGPAISKAEKALEEATAKAKKTREEAEKTATFIILGGVDPGGLALGMGPAAAADKVRTDGESVAKALTETAAKTLETARAPLAAAEKSRKAAAATLSGFDKLVEERHESLRKQTSYRDGIRDIVATMIVLRMDSSAEDRALLSGLYDITPERGVTPPVGYLELRTREAEIKSKEGADALRGEDAEIARKRAAGSGG